ncbi:hypothetical protein ACO22_03650 [Paracoccidioides brasiliensis]|uniref:Uncharacterized protein n=1 Tax=Paracoccidioides brasiliensis TaxID=121759 RepID=A0A1D2JFC0_PARBR|nr:hypothetical protein ACO22_03650 [Paracoccidioides brasiliensis]
MVERREETKGYVMPYIDHNAHHPCVESGYQCPSRMASQGLTLVLRAEQISNSRSARGGSERGNWHQAKPPMTSTSVVAEGGSAQGPTEVQRSAKRELRRVEGQ